MSRCGVHVRRGIRIVSTLLHERADLAVGSVRTVAFLGVCTDVVRIEGLLVIVDRAVLG